MASAEQQTTERGAAFTPGPWTARGGAYGCSDMRPDMLDWSSSVECIAPYEEAEDSDLAGETVETQVVATARGRTVKEAEANAWLIAAAPELYVALQTLVHQNEASAFGDGLPTEKAWRDAYTALAKARGEARP